MAASRRIPQFFPPPEFSRGSAPLMVGGELSLEWLEDAYGHGIFPWPTNSGVLTWWSPDPRGVIEFDRFHVPRRLERTLASGKFRVTCNRAFVRVMHGCGTAQNRRQGTWITPALLAAYARLHERGLAASVETWHGEHLVGGVYGVAMGGLFAAESMFYVQRDASKVALVHLVRHLQARGYQLLDIQMVTPHTAMFGALAIRRTEYLRRLHAAFPLPVTFGNTLESSG